MLLQEVEADVNKWRNLLSSWTRGLNIIKMSAVSKLIYRCNPINQNLHSFFFSFFFILVEIDRLTPKFIKQCKNPRKAKTILKNKVGALTLSDETYKTALIKII